MAKITKEQWEQRVNEAGAGRYEFVRWDEEGNHESRDKCIVRCVNDGFVWASKVNNLVHGGQGCPSCSGRRRWTAGERIEQINELKNIEFISWVDSYKNNRSKASVRCTVDGFEWSSSVNNLVSNGRGCPMCAREFIGGIKRLPPESYIERLPHGVKFIKWHDKYKGSKSHMIVACVNGHVWNANPNNIIYGMQGCPSCAKTGYDPSKTGTLYALRSECGKYVKVGISNKPKQRHRKLKMSTPFKFNIIEQFEGGGAKIVSLENHFHENYESAGFTGFDGATEWLVCSNELLTELRRLSIEHE